VTAPLSFTEFLAHFTGVTKDGADWVATCPVHKGGQEAHPSLGLAEKASGPVLFCRSHHCDPNEILAAVELTWRDILPPKPGTNGANGTAWLPADVIYDYTSREGVLLYRVHRWHAVGSTPKKILQQAADGSWGLKGKGIPLVPYRLHTLTGPTVLIAEGEKAVNALVQAGFNATTNSGGSKKWRDSDTLALKACGITTLLILPDHDLPGREHADMVAASAAKHGLTSRRIVLPGLKEGEDAYDWLLTHTAAELEALLEAPEAAPGPEPAPVGQTPLIGYTLAQLALHVFPERQPLLWRGETVVFRAGHLAQVYAERGVGKTWFAQTLALVMATGTSALGFHTEVPLKVLYIDGEMGSDEIKSRFEVVEARVGVTPPPEALTVVAQDWQEAFMPRLDTVEGQQQIEPFVAAADVIVLDNRSCLFDSEGEKDPTAWQPAQNWLLSLRRRGKAVIVIHHSNRAGGARGISKPEDAMNWLIKLTKPDDYEQAQGARFLVTFEKHRGFHGVAVAPFLASLEEDGWHTQGMDGVTQAAVAEKLVEIVRLQHEAGAPVTSANMAISRAKVSRNVGLAAWRELLKADRIRQNHDKTFYVPIH